MSRTATFFSRIATTGILSPSTQTPEHPPMNAPLPADLMRTTAVHRPLRIALLGYRSHPHVGGQGIYIKYLSRALCELGHQVDVLSGPPYPQLDPRVRLIQIPSLDLYSVFPDHVRALRWHHLSSWSDLYEWWSMATGGFAEPYTFGRRVYQHLKGKRDQYDLIHDNQSLCPALLALQRAGWPVVATVHHPITRDRQLALNEAASLGARLLARRWYSFVSMQARVVRKLDHVITVSYASRRDVAHEFGRSIDSIEVIGNGIDTHRFCPLPELERQSWRIITTTSSDQPLKGFAVLLKALQRVRARHPAAHLQVIGKLRPDGSNARLLKRLGLDNCVRFEQGLSDAELVQAYAQASVAVCPSLYEGFGLPAAEAMSCGVPLVSSDGGALGEVVEDAGIVVPAGDSEALADALLRVLEQPALAADLAKRGRQRVEQHFCWQRVAQSLTDYYWRNLLPKAAQEVAENADH